MSLLRIQSLIVVSWFAVMIALIGTSVALGLPVTALAVAGWILLGSVPPIVLLKTFRGAGPATMSPVNARVASAPIAGSNASTAGSDRFGR